MTDTYAPRDARDVADMISWAAAEATPLELYSGSTKRSIGRPPQTEYGLDLSALTGVIDYEPAELVLTAKPATPLREIAGLLEAKGQMLAFEPADYGPLLGMEEGQGTLAGVYAANISGPRRLQAGAARDHALGIRAVSGRGEPFKSGGRVMKNVTGYDLTKGLAGSWGTLAVLTELTFKVLPKPEKTVTLVLTSLSASAASAAMTAAMATSCEVSGAAHLPANITGGLDIDGLSQGEAATVFRLEGFGPSVDARTPLLARTLEAFGPAERLVGDAACKLWRAIGDAVPFTVDLSRPLW